MDLSEHSAIPENQDDANCLISTEIRQHGKERETPFEQEQRTKRERTRLLSSYDCAIDSDQLNQHTLTTDEQTETDKDQHLESGGDEKSASDDNEENVASANQARFACDSANRQAFASDRAQTLLENESVLHASGSANRQALASDRAQKVAENEAILASGPAYRQANHSAVVDANSDEADDVFQESAFGDSPFNSSLTKKSAKGNHAPPSPKLHPLKIDRNKTKLRQKGRNVKGLKLLIGSAKENDQATSPVIGGYFQRDQATFFVIGGDFQRDQATFPVIGGDFQRDQATFPVIGEYFQRAQATSPVIREYFQRNQAIGGYFQRNQSTSPVIGGYFQRNQATSPVIGEYFQSKRQRDQAISPTIGESKEEKLAQQTEEVGRFYCLFPPNDETGLKINKFGCIGQEREQRKHIGPLSVKGEERVGELNDIQCGLPDVELGRRNAAPFEDRNLFLKVRSTDLDYRLAEKTRGCGGRRRGERKERKEEEERGEGDGGSASSSAAEAAEIRQEEEKELSPVELVKAAKRRHWAVVYDSLVRRRRRQQHQRMQQHTHQQHRQQPQFERRKIRDQGKKSKAQRDMAKDDNTDLTEDIEKKVLQTALKSVPDRLDVIEELLTTGYRFLDQSMEYTVLKLTVLVTRNWRDKVTRQNILHLIYKCVLDPWPDEEPQPPPSSSPPPSAIAADVGELEVAVGEADVAASAAVSEAASASASSAAAAAVKDGMKKKELYLFSSGCLLGVLQLFAYDIFWTNEAKQVLRLLPMDHAVCPRLDRLKAVLTSLPDRGPWVPDDPRMTLVDLLHNFANNVRSHPPEVLQKHRMEIG